MSNNGSSISGHVLLVEDNGVNQKVATCILKRLGLTYSVANNGGEAVALIKSGEAFDLVLMDIYMPVMDGIEATRQIRLWEQEAAMQPHRIVALSAASQSDIQDAFAAGVDGYIPKPIDVKKTKALLQEHLSS